MEQLEQVSNARVTREIANEPQTDSSQHDHDLSLILPSCVISPEILNSDPPQTYFTDLGHHENDLMGFDDTSLTLNGLANNAEESRQPFPFTETFFGPASSPLSPSQYFGNLYEGFDSSRPPQDRTNTLQGSFLSAPSTPFSSPVRAGCTRFPFDRLGRQDTVIDKLENTIEKPVTNSQSSTPEELDALRYYAVAMLPTLFPFMASDDTIKVNHQLLALCESSIMCRSSVLAQSIYCQQSELRRFGLGSVDFEDDTSKYGSTAFDGMYDVLRKKAPVDNVASQHKTQVEVRVCAAHLLLFQVWNQLCHL